MIRSLNSVLNGLLRLFKHPWAAVFVLPKAAASSIESVAAPTSRHLQWGRLELACKKMESELNIELGDKNADNRWRLHLGDLSRGEVSRAAAHAEARSHTVGEIDQKGRDWKWEFTSTEFKCYNH